VYIREIGLLLVGGDRWNDPAFIVMTGPVKGNAGGPPPEADHDAVATFGGVMSLPTFGFVVEKMIQVRDDMRKKGVLP
jgi:hypothetical protein